jgi:predicted transcriptional regulator
MQLSKMSGVSQSTIAKIEKGSIHGSYESVVRIFDVLQEEMDRKRKGRLARDVMSRDIVSVQAKEKVKRASEMMRESGFSQLPVFEGAQPVGSVSEFGILTQLRDGTSMEDVGERSVRQIMSEAFPVISEDLPLETVTSLLATSRAVLVGSKGKINGIITSSDVLKLL